MPAACLIAHSRTVSTTRHLLLQTQHQEEEQERTEVVFEFFPAPPPTRPVANCLLLKQLSHSSLFLNCCCSSFRMLSQLPPISRCSCCVPKRRLQRSIPAALGGSSPQLPTSLLHFTRTHQQYQLLPIEKEYAEEKKTARNELLQEQQQLIVSKFCSRIRIRRRRRRACCS